MEEVCCKNSPVPFKGTSRDFRYWLQKAGQRLLYHYDPSGERISFGGCGMGLRYGADNLQIHYHADSDSMSFIGLAHCGNPWVCPVCAPRIGAGRMDEIKVITARMIELGYSYLFATYTAHHDEKTPLREFGAMIKEAKRSFNACTVYKRLKERFNLCHSITATEVTDDDPSTSCRRTGWNFHLHGLLFLKRSFLSESEAAQFSMLASMAWQEECKKVGLVASLDRGFYLQTIQQYAKKTGLEKRFDDLSEDKKKAYVAQVSEYFSKSLGFELTGATRKNAKKGKYGADRVTQWGLMLEAVKGNLRARDRWIDFVHSMKGFNVIRCSPGLKALCEIEEKSDKDFLKGEEAQKIVSFGVDKGLKSYDWYPVAKQGRMGHLLTLAAETEPVEAVKSACDLAKNGVDALTCEYLGIGRFNPVWAGCDGCSPVRIGEHFALIEKQLADQETARVEARKLFEREERRKKKVLFDQAIDALDPSVVFASMKNLLYARKRRMEQGLSLDSVPLSMPWVGSLSDPQFLLPGFSFEKMRYRYNKNYEKNFSLRFVPLRI